MDIEYMYDEIGDICVLFCKGHYSKEEFIRECKNQFDEEDIEKIIDEPVHHKWGKKVGFFEYGERIGWTLSIRNNKTKGYFPMTIIEIN